MSFSNFTWMLNFQRMTILFMEAKMIAKGYELSEPHLDVDFLMGDNLFMEAKMTLKNRRT